MQQDVASEEPQMTNEEHCAWYLYDLLASWMNPTDRERMRRAILQWPPSENQLPKSFRDKWLQLVIVGWH